MIKLCDEFLRLQELHSLNIFHELEDIRLNYITKFARHALKTPICAISLVDSDRVWIKSKNGLDATELARDISVCGHAICEIETDSPLNRIFEIEDMKKDNRFFDNPLVIKSFRIRSYMGYVLQSDSGKNIGALFIADAIPREFTDINKQMLTLLGSITENIIHKRHHLDGIKHKFD